MRAARFDLTATVPAVAELGRVHFVAIGGAGMSAVARLMLASGTPVSGSDAQDSATLRALATAGADVRVGHSPANIADVDTVIVSSAIRDDNPELLAARGAGLRVLHRSQGLAAVAAGRRVVAVAGANGKSTTTAMVVVALAEAGSDPGFACGAEIPQLGTNAAPGSGADFVVEADESDGTFVVYRPDVAIVTNVQADHLDFYGDLAGVEAAYRRFVDSMSADGLLVACADDRGSSALASYAEGTGRRVLTYGFAEDAQLRLVDATGSEDGTSARLVVEGVSERLVLRVPGRHNLENAAGAFGALTAGCGLDRQVALMGLTEFTGAARRFESHGEHGGVRVIDDYAHNAPKVAAAVATGAETARRRGGRLVTVFQPHLYSRTRDFAADFAAALATADEVVLMEIYGAREEPIEGVGSDLIAVPLRALPRHRGVHLVAGPDDAVEVVTGLVHPGDVVMTIGAGDVTRLAPRIGDALDQPRTPDE
jgi:UDP-N-acetylmuramate--alanine ligase